MSGFLTNLGLAVWLKDELKLGLAETLSLWGQIDTHDVDPEKRPNDSLYARLFLNPAVRTLAGDSNPFTPDSAGNELANTSTTLASLAPAVLAALRLTAADLPHLCSLAGLAADESVDLAKLSILHRYAVLARALRLSIKDLATLRDFIGSNPFADPATTVQFLKKARKLLASRFSVAQMAYLYWHADEPARPVAQRQEEVVARLLALRAALRQLAEDLGPADSTETRLRKALGQVMDQARADQVMKLLNRSVVYTTTLTTSPGVTFPAPLRSRITYDVERRELRLASPMTAAERSVLLGLGGAAGYPEAIGRLFDQSVTFFDEAREFIEREIIQFVPGEEAKAQLIENDALDAAGRQAFVLDRLLSFLSRSLVSQMLANSLGLDSAIADQMLTTALRLPGAPGHPLLEDFLALREGVLTANYFTSPDWTGPATVRIDPKVDFATRVAWPDPALVGDTFSVRWTGQLTATATESYTFIVRAGGSVRLEINGLVATGPAPDGELRVVTTLQAGAVYGLTLDYAHTTGPFNVQLAWETRSMPRAIVSEDRIIPETVWENAEKAFILLHKAAMLVNGFKMTVVEVAYLSTHSADFDGFTFDGLPISPNGNDAERRAAGLLHFRRWERLFDLFTFRDSLPQPERMLDIFAASNPDEAQALLVAASGWDKQAVVEATGADGFNAALAFFNTERGLVRLASCLALVRRAGVSPAKLFHWAASAPGPEQAQEVKNAVKARYEEAEWLAVAKGLNDPLRERQRSALVDHILVMGSLPNRVRTSMELFEHFLIDVDMSSCLPTSRIKQAISSVQLFVQRCLMALEPEVSPALLDADQWKWMRNYRVWEANRKVFLYPENWIEPELRDDKSPFFEEMENELLQNDLTQDTAEAAFLSYLEKLDEVARLDVRGMYWEHESEVSRWDDENWTNPELDPRERADILHVFARTQGTPPIYYYRRLINHKLWTPWEKVQADIEGDHLIPVVFNRRLYLFWPLFRETTDPDQNPPQDGERTRPPNKRLEIQLAWSEYKDGKWSAKKITATAITMEYLPAEDRSLVYFDVRHTDGSIIIECRWEDPSWAIQETTGGTIAGRLMELWRPVLRRRPPRTPQEVRQLLWRLGRADASTRPFYISPVYKMGGHFVISGCDSQTTAVSASQEVASVEALQPPDGFVDSQMTQSLAGALILKREDGSRQWALGLPDAPVPIPFRLLYQRQFSSHLLQTPFIYQDREHTYFVTPEQTPNVAQQVSTPRQVALIVTPGLYLTSFGGARAMAAPAIDPSANSPARVTWNEWDYCVGDLSAPLRDVGSPARSPTQLKLRFHTFFHPYVCEFIKRLKRRNVSGLLALDLQKQSDFTRNGANPDGDREFTQFNTRYHPTNFVDQDYPKEDVDFDNGAYGLCNWELFFHVPLLIADRLNKNQRFEEARQWFHYILDPTTSSTEPAPQRFWNVLPFYNNYLAPRDQIGELLYLLSYRGSEPETLRRKEEMEAQVKA